MGVGGCPAVVAQWQSTGGSSQGCPGFDSWRLPAFFTFLYFHLITSKFLYYTIEQHTSSILCLAFSAYSMAQHTLMKSWDLDLRIREQGPGNEIMGMESWNKNMGMS